MPRTTPRLRAESKNSKLSRLRIMAGYTHQQLAEALGVSVSSIKRWETGSIPTSKYLPALARALHCTIDDLVSIDADGV